MTPQIAPAPITSTRFPWLLCASCALLPFTAVHISYVLAASAGDVPWCFPYLDSCTSISATGRNGVASYMFRGLMLPSSTLIAGFWWLHGSWLRSVLPGHASRIRSMSVLGWLACAGLVLYVSVLGEPGELWRAQRRAGTILFFSFTYLAQLLLAAELRRIPATLCDSAARIGHRMLRLCIFMLAVGFGSVTIRAINPVWHDGVEDAVEWQLALLLQLNFLLCATLWRRGRWRLQFLKSGTSAP